MKINKKAIVLILSSLFSVLLLFPLTALADGMVIPSPGYWINETEQKGVIFYDRGMETLVLSISFQGDANDFAWVVPVPNKPEIKKGSDDLFVNLNKLTSGYRAYDAPPIMELKEGENAEGNGVTVVETKQVDYYDVAVLKSSDKNSLAKWLEENKYNFPESASYILNSYIQNNWYFVAMKINPESLGWSDVSEQLRTGHATPVILSFKAKNIVYPMRISSVVSREGNVKIPEYVEGKLSQAVNISKPGSILSFNSSNILNGQAGTIEMWIKPNTLWESGSIANNELFSATDSNGRNIFEFKRAKYVSYLNVVHKEGELDNLNSTRDHPSSRFYDVLQLTNRLPNGVSKTWTTSKEDFNWDNKWYYIAVTWSEGQMPVFYINGEEYKSDAGSQISTWNGNGINNIEKVFFGQKGPFGSAQLDSYLDEVRVSNRALTPEQIKDSYHNVLDGQALSADDVTVFLAHFDNSLKEEISGKNLSYQKAPNSSMNSYRRVRVILYVIADHKKTLPNFYTGFANWIDKDSIENLAFDDQGNPLFNPSEKKYFLTRLSRSMERSQMSSDLFIRNDSNNSTIGKRISSVEGPDSLTPFYVAISLAVLVSVGLALTILRISRQPDRIKNNRLKSNKKK